MRTLDDICSPISEELEIFNRLYKKSLKSDITLISTIVDYILKQRSKRIRPILVLLTSKLCGKPNDNTYTSAVLVEMLHTATLIHDDIVDESDTRRGMPSINAIWKNKTSVLMGDWLFSRALSCMLSLNNFDMLKILARTAEYLSEGEIRQIEATTDYHVNQGIYFQMIFSKTASLIAASCQLGAMSVGASQSEANALYEYGKNLGIAFQLKDDILDFIGDVKEMGKPIHADLKLNTMTLPLIYTINNAYDIERKRIIDMLNSGGKVKNFSDIIDIIKAKGGIEYTENKIDEFSKKATDSLSIFPESEIKSKLIDFIWFNKERRR